MLVASALSGKYLQDMEGHVKYQIDNCGLKKEECRDYLWSEVVRTKDFFNDSKENQDDNDPILKKYIDDLLKVKFPQSSQPVASYQPNPAPQSNYDSQQYNELQSNYKSLCDLFENMYMDILTAM